MALKRITAVLLVLVMIFSQAPMVSAAETQSQHGPAALTTPDIEPELHGEREYVGYYDGVVSNSSSLKVRWEDVDADSYNVAIKVLDGEPAPGDNELGDFLYSYTTGYTRTYISLSKSKMESASGKWIKVFVQAVFESETYGCHYYFRVEADDGSLDVDKASVKLAWNENAEELVQISGADNFSYDVEYDVPASVETNGFNYEWLKVTKSGSGLIVTPNRANYAACVRTAVVTVTSGNESKTVTVTQAACSEAAPTIQLHRGSTVYADGDSIGSFLIPQETMDVDIISTNVRRVTAILCSSDGKQLDTCTSTSRISLDISSVPAGQYRIEVYASNSDTANDYWKQSPFSSEPMMLNFRLIDPNAVGSKDFKSFDEAIKMVETGFSSDWSTVGKINYVKQYFEKTNGLYYYVDKWVNNTFTEGYWTSNTQAEGKCTRAAACMAWSYMGITAFPKNVYPIKPTDITDDPPEPYVAYADKILGCETVSDTSCTMEEFSTMYERYANDTTGKYSPIVIFTKHKTNQHAFTILGRCVSKEYYGYYYVADPGHNVHFGMIKLEEVLGEIRVADYITIKDVDSEKYNINYPMKRVSQYIKRDAPETPVSNLELSQNAVNMTWTQDNQASIQVSGVSSYSVSTTYNVPADIQNIGYNYDWLNCEKSGNTLTLMPNRPNYADATRTATVTVAAGGQSKTITVTQAACGESAPTIKVFNGNTVYGNGSFLGTFQKPAEVKFSVSSTNVRKVTAYLRDAEGNDLAETTNLSNIRFDLSDLPAGNYKIAVYASNSDTANDYWKQNPISGGSLTLIFELLGETPDDMPPVEPTDPEPTDPEPTDPEPTDPEPTDPEPTDPEPTDPEPTDPEPTDPEPTDPEPTDPEPTDPEPTDPEPTDPEPTDPEPTDPEPTDPEPTDPEPTDPEPTDPEPTDPEPTDPEPTDPEPTDPEPTDPEPTEPEPADPEPTEPKPTEPAPSEPDKPAVNSVIRLAGETRYETSLAIATQMKEVLGIDRFSTVVLANSDNFADALAGSYLAAVKKAPIIIGKEKYADIVCDYLNANLAEDGTVYILGGEDVLPDSILANLRVGHRPVRLAGEDRYDTNLEILTHVGIEKRDILIATGRDFADSLSASATGLPILLVNGKAGKALSEDQKAFLATVTGDIYIIGGESAVPASMVEQIEAASGKTTTRIAGGSRYETSIEIAKAFLKDAESAVVAYASTFPDGLCGGPLAYATKAPLILTKNGKTEAPAYAEAAGIHSGYVLGSEELIGDGFAKQIFSAEEILK
ncbi:MAG: cell wall-binding repeat-containing protein [Oscillospiraceae bacterium]|nr:cell wall-binding repeat-containing protein [Oscillospiraceae bacterium]